MTKPLIKLPSVEIRELEEKIAKQKVEIAEQEVKYETKIAKQAAELAEQKAEIQRLQEMLRLAKNNLTYAELL